MKRLFLLAETMSRVATLIFVLVEEVSAVKVNVVDLKRRAAPVSLVNLGSSVSEEVEKTHKVGKDAMEYATEIDAIAGDRSGCWQEGVMSVTVDNVAQDLSYVSCPDADNNVPRYAGTRQQCCGAFAGESMRWTQPAAKREQTDRVKFVVYVPENVSKLQFQGTFVPENPLKTTDYQGVNTAYQDDSIYLKWDEHKEEETTEPASGQSEDPLVGTPVEYTLNHLFDASSVSLSSQYMAHSHAMAPFDWVEGAPTDWQSSVVGPSYCAHTKDIGNQAGWWYAKFNDGKARRIHRLTFIPRHDGFSERLDGACVRLQLKGQEDTPPSDAFTQDAPCDRILPSVLNWATGTTVTIDEEVIGFRLIAKTHQPSGTNYLAFCGVSINGMVEASLVDKSRITAEQSDGVHGRSEPSLPLDFTPGHHTNYEEQPLNGGKNPAVSTCSATGVGNEETNWSASFDPPTHIKVMQLWNRNNYAETTTDWNTALRSRLDYARVFLNDETTAFATLPKVTPQGLQGTGLLIDREVTKITVKTPLTSDHLMTICGARFFEAVPTPGSDAVSYSAGDFDFIYPGGWGNFGLDRVAEHVAFENAAQGGAGTTDMRSQGNVDAGGPMPSGPGWWYARFKGNGAKWITSFTLWPRSDCNEGNTPDPVSCSAANSDIVSSRLDGACIRLQLPSEPEPSNAAEAPDNPCDIIVPAKGVDRNPRTIVVNQRVVGFKIITAAPAEVLQFSGITNINGKVFPSDNIWLHGGGYDLSTFIDIMDYRPDGAQKVTIDNPEPGFHTLSIFPREDGTRVGKLRVVSEGTTSNATATFVSGAHCMEKEDPEPFTCVAAR